MTFPSHSPSVPLFHSLESGTVEQDQASWNTQGNMGGTSPLKALANKILKRNSDGNKSGTESSKSVPLPPPCSTASGTDVETDNLLYEFNERVAIAEYDGEASPMQAHCIAYLDAFISLLTHVAEDKPDYQDWLRMKIQVALERLESQSFPILN